jgi:hypothetical protein
VSHAEYQDDLPPVGHARIVYMGPVAPHWEVYADYGDPNHMEEFRARVLARLVLITPRDPQVRRNRVRIDNDARRERITVEWEPDIPVLTDTRHF